MGIAEEYRLDKTTRETSLRQPTRRSSSTPVPHHWYNSPTMSSIRFSGATTLADAQYMDIIASRFDESDGVYHGLSHQHADRLICSCHGCLSRRLGNKSSDPGK